jgi:hypothetical protein
MAAAGGVNSPIKRRVIPLTEEVAAQYFERPGEPHPYYALVPPRVYFRNMEEQFNHSSSVGVDLQEYINDYIKTLASRQFWIGTERLLVVPIPDTPGGNNNNMNNNNNDDNTIESHFIVEINIYSREQTGPTAEAGGSTQLKQIASIYGEWDVAGPRVVIEIFDESTAFRRYILNDSIPSIFIAGSEINTNSLGRRVNEKKGGVEEMNVIRNPLNLPTAISPTAHQPRPNLRYGAAGRPELPDDVIRAWIAPAVNAPSTRDPASALARLVNGGRRGRRGRRHAKTNRRRKGKRAATKRKRV